MANTQPKPFDKLDVEDALGKLTVAEKVALLAGKDMVCPRCRWLWSRPRVRILTSFPLSGTQSRSLA